MVGARRAGGEEMAMADGLLSSVSRVVENLESWIPSSFPGSSPSSSWSPTLQDRLEKLRRMQPRIQAVLADAEEREIQDESVKLWLREIKDVAYQADDVLDLHQYELLRAEREAATIQGSNQVSNSNTCPITDDSFWGKITCRIEKIISRFDEISKQRDALHLREGSGGRRHGRARVPPPTTSVVAVPNIYGREADTKKMMESIFSPFGEHNPSVIPVVGMGGVGKTALVQHVYNDQAVCEHFELRAWVCVSDDFEVGKLTRRILEAITKEACDLHELSVLQENLREKLCGKRFLLVLDDLWNEDAALWHLLLAPLRHGLRGSTIITTTRSENIAKITQTMPPLRLACLSVDDCWAIFQHYAFHGQVPSRNQKLLAVGKEIVRKCKGLPLASASLGGLLHYESDIDKWEDVLRSEIWDLDENGRNGILPTLMLSYAHLPTNLKRCFVYCATFPKDFSFTKSQLVRLWMAQGFIQFHRVRQSEETGIQYFEELLQRSFFQLDHKYSPEDEDKFVMHDLIHDLAVSVSGRECVMIKTEEIRRLSHDNHLLRHIAFVPCSSEITVTFQSLCCDGLAGLRSLLLIRRTDLWAAKDVVTEIPEAMMQKLESLRALDLSYIHLKHVPDSIGNLKHLRYLDLSGTRIAVLPESVCQLYLMQTMDLSYARITGLPDSIKNLKELRYVNLCHTGIRMLPETVGELTNLRTLDLGYTDINNLPQSVGNLRHLTHLDLSGTNITWLPEPVCMLYNLRTLNLNNVAIYELPDSIGNLQNLRCLNLNETGVEFLPESFCKLYRLRMLNLSFSRIKQLPESIGELGNLCHLDLTDTHVTRLPESICEIHNLQSLMLKSCSELERLPKEMRSLANLQHLDFNGQYASRVWIPRGIGRLTSLRTLPVFNVGRDGDSCGVQELMNLTELRGRLEISRLHRVLNPESASMANLRMKTHIDKLALNWDYSRPPSHLDGSDGSDELQWTASDIQQTHVLERLWPPSGLTDLEVRGYGGISFPLWMGDPSFSRLVQIVLDGCTNCRRLPPLGQLPSLRQLTILRASSVEHVGPEFRCVNGPRGAGFPSLEVMMVQDMTTWVTWMGVESGDFPRLAQLEVNSCPRLQRDLPNFSHSLPMLKVLKLTSCQSLECVPLHNLPNLATAELVNCDRLAHIDFGSQPCSSSSSSSSSATSTENWALRNLWIRGCPLAGFLPAEGHLLPRTLTYLYIESNCPRLLDWCKSDGRSWLAQIPNTKIWQRDGDLCVWTSVHSPTVGWKEWKWWL